MDGKAEVEATFHAHCTGNGPHALALPLDGVELIGEVLLDGARAFPVALAAPKVGYTLPVRGSGSHKIVLRFRAAVSVTPDDPRDGAGPGRRAVKFTAPRLVQPERIRC